MAEIKAYSLNEMGQLFKEKGLPLFRAKQVYQWLYQKGARSYEEMTNLPKSLREALASELPLFPANVVDKQVSLDGTRKYIISFADGAATEMVAIPSQDRLTVCFSTQVGCAMACAFCATGHEGFTRNLLPGEMVEQVLIAQNDMGRRVSNLVAMGQGEPFLNYDNVRKALDILNGDQGLNIAARRITVSTCGIFQGIERFSHEPEQFTLAVSLHSAVQETRDELMPKVANQPLKELHGVLRKYQDLSKRRITFEYLMISNKNDDEKHLEALVDFCRGLSCHVNIIPLNEIDDSPFKPASHRSIERFIERLQESGTEATLRQSRGGDIAGACGQLKNKKGY